MFERLEARARRIAQQRVEQKAGQVAEQLREELPGGIWARPTAEGVEISGRGLLRRFVLSAALRDLLSGVGP